MSDASVSFPVKNTRIVLIGSIITAVLSLFGFISLFSLVPFIYIYYRYGMRVGVYVAVLSILFFSIVIFGTEIMNNGVQDNNEVSQLLQDGTVLQDDTGVDTFDNNGEFPLDISNAISTYDIIAYSILEFTLKIIGIVCFLYFSSISWTWRFSIAVAIMSIGTAIYLFATKDILFNLIEEFFSMLQVNLEDQSLILQNQNLVIMAVVPISTAFVLLLNFLIATSFLSVKAGIYPSEYYSFALRKIILEQKNIALLIGTLVVSSLLIKNINVASVYAVYLLLVSILIILLCCKLLTGMALVHHHLQSKIRVHVGWYFFLNFIIILMPVLNVIVLSSYILLGILFDIKKLRNERRMK